MCSKVILRYLAATFGKRKNKMSAKTLIEERSKKYGKFSDNARIAQELKAVFKDSPNWEVLPDEYKEALDLITTKLSRMLSGEFVYDDNPKDIQGYMQLILDYLNLNDQA